MAKSKKGEGTTMDQSSPVIIRFETPKYGLVIIETSTQLRYHSDLSVLSKTYCYPKNIEQWKSASIDSYGLSLIWKNKFEAHIDQIIGLSFKIEPILNPKKRTG